MRNKVYSIFFRAIFLVVNINRLASVKEANCSRYIFRSGWDVAIALTRKFFYSQTYIGEKR